MTAPTVFLVDDNPAVRKSMQALVEAAGLAVETYASASEFLAAYDGRRSGCLVLDVRQRRGVVPHAHVGIDHRGGKSMAGS